MLKSPLLRRTFKVQINSAVFLRAKHDGPPGLLLAGEAGGCLCQQNLCEQNAEKEQKQKGMFH